MIGAWGAQRSPRVWIAGAILLLAAGCQNTDTAADRQIATQIAGPPAAILVSDFAISPKEVTTRWSGSERLTRDDRVGTAAELEVGHRFARAFAAGLVEEIRRMGLPAVRAGAPVPAGADTASIEGQFISLASQDLSAPGIVGFAADWAHVVADIQIYTTTNLGDRLAEDIEFNLADANLPPERLPAGALARLPAGSAAGALPAATAAELDAAARTAASAAAGQLRTFFTDQGWIARPAGA